MRSQPNGKCVEWNKISGDVKVLHGIHIVKQVVCAEKHTLYCQKNKDILAGLFGII